MRILAIETSCDETAIAIVDFRNRNCVDILSHIVSSQVKLHAEYGGVVPNLANREHQKNLVPILLHALRESRINPRLHQGQESRKRENKKSFDSLSLLLDSILAREPVLLRQFKKHLTPLSPPNIDAIAVTYGPGLAPALWVGVNFARALAVLWDKPLIPVNHMAGHLFSALLQESREKDSQFLIPNSQFSMLALLVSGGHTELVLVKKPWRFQIIGETRDDAVGEAFDKVARMLGLPYPGGPEISRLAATGDPQKYPLPSPMINTKNYDFSFSGLKTATWHLARNLRGLASLHEAKPRRELTLRQKADIAASFEKAAVDVLVKKTVRAAKEYKVRTVLLGGGVAANVVLRAALARALKREWPRSTFQVPSSDLCGDNALMIAAAAYMTGKKKVPTDVGTDANARLG